MFRTLSLLLLAALPAAAETVTVTRLVIADHAAPRLLVTDAAGATLLQLSLAEPVRLHHGLHHGQVALREAQLGRVSLLETGLRLEGHGDHGDLRLAAPSLLPVELRGPRPSHVVGSDGRLAVFFDGDGSASLIAAGQEAAPVRLSAAHAHHGVAYPFASLAGPRLAISEAPAAGERPSAVSLRGADGAELARREDCPRLHGEGRSGALIAFGCADGVLLLDARSGAFRKIANPEGAGERMVRNLAGGEDWRLLLGDFGPEAMMVVDPEANAMRVVPLPARRLHFTLDPARAETGFAITEDGVLHAFSTLDGTPRGRIQATGRYSLEGGAAVARPRLSAAGGLVAVTDPAAGRVALHDAETLALRQVIETGGRPFDIRLVSLTGESH
ncbi:hypothetical protein [Falsiroseomonas tokyonensis]|uniref:DUF1513 domain-containing protein n=1 Tax=Falsiroseomonas tokyonensis TaxID=430521 RepID=A0ABV7BXK4_9PROT|nr:hypothetical protein [Falsiroseomonas tokyonensis]MBU8539211.1 hypothetical protein [Falsiroseomonas tokyonensis]